MMEQSWYDNQPGERHDVGFRQSLFAVALAIFLPGAVLIYFAHVMVGGSTTLGLLLALVLGIGGFFASYGVVVLSERDFATVVRFGPAEMTWRTRDGRVLNTPFSEILRIVPSTWKGDRVGDTFRRYAVVMTPGRLGLRRGIWLNPENKTRLEALRQARKAP